MPLDRLCPPLPRSKNYLGWVHALVCSSRDLVREHAQVLNIENNGGEDSESDSDNEDHGRTVAAGSVGSTNVVVFSQPYRDLVKAHKRCFLPLTTHRPSATTASTSASTSTSTSASTSTSFLDSNHGITMASFPTADEDVVMLDVGTGSSCIFPLLAARLYSWRALATDVDAVSLANASRIIAANGLAEAVATVLVRDPQCVYEGVAWTRVTDSSSSSSSSSKSGRDGCDSSSNHHEGNNGMICTSTSTSSDLSPFSSSPHPPLSTSPAYASTSSVPSSAMPRPLPPRLRPAMSSPLSFVEYDPLSEEGPLFHVSVSNPPFFDSLEGAGEGDGTEATTVDVAEPTTTSSSSSSSTLSLTTPTPTPSSTEETGADVQGIPFPQPGNRGRFGGSIKRVSVATASELAYPGGEVAFVSKVSSQSRNKVIFDVAHVVYVTLMSFMLFM